MAALDAALDISAGPAHFSDCRATTFDLVMARTGHLDICRAIRFQIMLARTITNLNIYFLRGRPPHIPADFAQSFCYRDASWCESDLSIKHTGVSDQTVFRSRRTRYFNANIRGIRALFFDKHMCKQFGVLLSVWQFRLG